VTLVPQSQMGTLLGRLPAGVRGQAAAAIQSGFAVGLNDLMVVTAAVALAGTVFALLLIRPPCRPAPSAPSAAVHQQDEARI
jgi:hypothetical protein